MPGISVNGTLISNEEIREATAQLRAQVESNGAELSFEERLQLRREASGRLIEKLLIAQEANRLGLAASDDEVDKAIASLAPRGDGVEGCRAGMDSPENAQDIRKRLVVDKLLAHWLKSLKKPSSGEVKDFYRANRQRFWRPEMVRAAHILKPTREEAEALRNRLLNGEDFAAVASEASDCKENAGDLGYFPRGTMVPEFEAVVFETPAGQLTPVFETSFGFHVVLVIDRKPEGIRTLPEVAAEIEAALTRVLQDRTVEQRLAQLHSAANIQEVA